MVDDSSSWNWGLELHLFSYFGVETLHAIVQRLVLQRVHLVVLRSLDLDPLHLLFTRLLLSERVPGIRVARFWLRHLELLQLVRFDHHGL